MRVYAGGCVRVFLHYFINEILMVVLITNSMYRIAIKVGQICTSIFSVTLSLAYF